MIRKEITQYLVELIADNGKTLKLGESYGEKFTVNVAIENQVEEVDNIPEPNPELDESKAKVSAAIKEYDKSEAVNSFFLQGSQQWIDRDLRIAKSKSLNDEKLQGRKESVIWLNGLKFTLPIDTALQMLSALEVYANDCFNITSEHIANIEKLQSVEEVESYDYTKCYPKILEF